MNSVKSEVKYTASENYNCLEFLRKSSVELNLVYCGKEVCIPGHTYGPASRQEYLLHYILNGKGKFFVDGKQWNLVKHNAFLIMPDETTTYAADNDDPWTYIWIAFDGMKAMECLSHAGFSAEQRVQSFEREKELCQCVENILTAYQLTYANDLIRQSQLTAFLAHLIQENQDRTGRTVQAAEQPKQVYVDYAVKYIEDNYDKDIKVDDICRHVGLTRGYLTKIFKQVLSTSPYDYLMEVRINRASSLLKTTELPVNQVAQMVGYRDALVFSKAFKQKTGYNPKSFRNSSRTLILSDSKET